MRILIVDDEPLLRYHLRSLLMEADASLEILEAENGEVALAILRRMEAEAAFIDIRMPRMDGLSVMEQLKQEGKDIPWVVLSSYSEFDYAKKALGSGALGYALKPPSKDEIQNLLQGLSTAVLRRHRERVHFFALEWAHPESSVKGKVQGWYRCGVYAEDSPSGVEQNSFSLELIERSIRQGQYHLCAVARDSPYPFSLDLICRTELENRELAEQASFSFINSAMAASRGKKNEQVSARVLCILAASGSSIMEAQEALPALRKLLEYRALLPPGIQEQKQARDLLQKFLPQDLVMAQKASCLIHELRRRDGSAFRLTAADLAAALAQAALDSRHRILRYLEQVFGPSLAPLIGANTIQEDEVKACLLELFICPYSTTDPVDSVKNYLLRHYTERLSLAELASRFSLSPNYLSTLFHTRIGKTFMTYLTELRLEKARELLRSGKSVKECARMVGYRDERHFAQLYRRHFGYPPATDKERR